MNCQASSSKFNEWLYIPHVDYQMQKILSILCFMFHLSFFFHFQVRQIFFGIVVRIMENDQNKKKNISLFVSKKWKLQQKPVRTQTNKFRDNLDIFALVGFKIRNCLPFLDLHVPCFGICPLFIDFLHCREKKLRFSQVVAWIVPSKIFVEQKKYSRLPIWTKSFMLNLCVAARCLVFYIIILRIVL